VPVIEEPPNADVDQAKLKLSQGLKSCHTVVDGYRAMLSRDDAVPDEADETAGAAAPDDGE
jgi:hypothetical protein